MNKINKIINKYLLGFVSIVFLFVAWEFSVNYHLIDPIFIGSPHKIFNQLIVFVKSPNFLSAFSNSAKAFLEGYVLAFLIGVPLGLALGINKTLNKLISPYIYILNTIPHVAIVPILVIWFGLGITAKTVIVFIMVFSPAVIYSIDSVKTVDDKLLEVAETFDIRGIKKYWNIHFFHSLPYIFSAAKLGVGRGLAAVVLAEVFGLGIGIAYYIPYYGSTFQTDKLMAVIFIVVIINFLLVSIVKSLQKKIVFWSESA